MPRALMPSPLRLPFWLPLLLLLGLLVAEFAGLLSAWDEQGQDWLLRAEARHRAPSPDIVLVNIDQKSLEDLNAIAGSWPWPRALHAELMEGIQRQRPRALVFDLMLSESDSFRPDSDALLRDTARQYDNLYFPSLLLVDGQGGPAARLPPSVGAEAGEHAEPDARPPLLLPLVLAPENWRGGLINFKASRDGLGREQSLYLHHEGWRFPSLPAQLARDLGWPLPEGDSFRLHWHGRPPASVSYATLIDDFGRGAPTRPADEFTGKIVIVGAAAPGLQDFRPTPVSASLPGPEILATALSNLQRQDWLRELPWRPALLLVLLPALGGAFARRLGPLPIGLALGATSLLLLAASFLLLRANWFAPVSVSLGSAWLLYVLLTVNAQWQERRGREAAVTLFRRFLDPRVVDDLVKTGELSREKKPEAREITLLFSDIRGFTTLSETRTPEAVVELLNRYFSQQVDVIFRHGGTLDKFIGDAIMAFWNAPTENPQHAVQAVAAALDMARALDAFKAELAASDGTLGDFDIGIGLHTGPAVVGFLGSNDRLDYTAIGDTVNLASRIEGCTKGVARVLVSQATREACEREAPGRFVFHDHGEFHVKGRDQGVVLLEPRPADNHKH